MRKNMFKDAKGFLVCKGLAAPDGIEALEIEKDMWIIDKRLHKFPDDEVCCNHQGKVFFLDGYVVRLAAHVAKG